MSGSHRRPARGREPRVTFRRCSVFAADVASVRPGNWIGDAIVAFYFACLEELLELQRRQGRRAAAAAAASACSTPVVVGGGTTSPAGPKAATAETADGGAANNTIVVATAATAAPHVGADRGDGGGGATGDGGGADAARGSAGDPRGGGTGAVSAAAATTAEEDALYLMDPMASQMAVYAQDAEEVLEDLGDVGLQRKRLVLIPVNDNLDPTRVAGGSHWSLLAYFATTRQFLHFDSSMQSNNHEIATGLARKLRLVLGLQPVAGSGSDGKGGRGGGASVTVKRVPCCQQTNGSDCGVFMLKFAHALVTKGTAKGVTAASAPTRQQIMARLESLPMA